MTERSSSSLPASAAFELESVDSLSFSLILRSGASESSLESVASVFDFRLFGSREIFAANAASCLLLLVAKHSYH
jgi:hypothetical protein